MSNREQQSRDEAPPRPAGPQPLPMATIEWLWAQLGLRYGHFLTARWEGFNLAAVKEDWRYVLKGLTDAQLDWGLEYLPAGRTPDAGEFRKLCLEAPQPELPLQLPRKRGPVQVAPQVREAIASLLQPVKHDEPLRVVVARQYVAAFGDKPHLTPFQKGCLAHYRDVLARYEAVRQRHQPEEQAA